MTTEEIIIRASSTSGWPDCNRRGAAGVFATIIRGMGYELRKRPAHIGALVGSGTHEGARVVLEEKAKSGSLPPLSVIGDAAVTTLRKRAEDEGMMLDDETPSLNHAERQVVRMSEAYMRHTAPSVNPVLVETRLEARIPFTRNPMVLSGQADAVAIEPNGPRDLKTGKRLGTHRPQIGSYGLLSRTHKVIADKVMDRAYVDFVPRVPLTKPQEMPRSFLYDLATCEQAAIGVIKHMDQCLTTFIEGDEERAILPGDPWAFTANPNSTLCSEKFCSAWGTEFCTEHRKENER